MSEKQYPMCKFCGLHPDTNGDGDCRKCSSPFTIAALRTENATQAAEIKRLRGALERISDQGELGHCHDIAAAALKGDADGK